MGSTKLSKPLSRSMQIDIQIDSKDEIDSNNPIDTPVRHELYASQHKEKYASVSLKQRILETLCEIIGINLLFLVFYLIFMLFKDSLSEAMHEDIIPLIL